MLLEDEMDTVVPGLRYVDQRGDEVLQAAAGAASAKVGSVMSPRCDRPIARRGAKTVRS